MRAVARYSRAAVCTRCTSTKLSAPPPARSTVTQLGPSRYCHWLGPTLTDPVGSVAAVPELSPAGSLHAGGPARRASQPGPDGGGSLVGAGPSRPLSHATWCPGPWAAGACARLAPQLRCPCLTKMSQEPRRLNSRHGAAPRRECHAASADLRRRTTAHAETTQHGASAGTQQACSCTCAVARRSDRAPEHTNRDRSQRPQAQLGRARGAVQRGAGGVAG